MTKKTGDDGIEEEKVLRALKRLIGVDQEKIIAHKKKVEAESGEVDNDVRETERSINKGARRSKGKFRL